MKTLVVARWQEDAGWLDQVPADWTIRVVQKDDDLPNRGREPASFLHAIIGEYDTIGAGETWAFVQGNPFDHCPDLLNRLDRPVAWFSPLGTCPYYSDGVGRPHHHGVPVARCYESWLGKPFPDGEIEFWAGGQFAVTGEALRSRPVEFWRAMYGDLMAGEDLTPWAAERLWPAIFGRGR